MRCFFRSFSILNRVYVKQEFCSRKEAGKTSFGDSIQNYRSTCTICLLERMWLSSDKYNNKKIFILKNKFEKSVNVGNRV